MTVTAINVSPSPRLPRPVEAALSELQVRTWQLHELITCVAIAAYACSDDGPVTKRVDFKAAIDGAAALALTIHDGLDEDQFARRVAEVEAADRT